MRGLRRRVLRWPLVSYTAYGLTAKGIKATSIGDAFRHGLTSPVGIGLQIAMLALLVALLQVDWGKRIGVRAKRSDH